MKLFKKFNEKGFSVIEVILAAALFMILATGAVVVVLQGLDSNRLGEEQTVASQYASEGIEASRSIKNQNFAYLVNSVGTGIVASSSGVWKFSGSSNVLSSKYTRVLTVSDVQRDGSGNIVASGGTLDPLTKKITSTVSWNFTPTRSDSVILSTYLTNWRLAIGAKGGVLVYGDGGTTTDAIMYRILDSSGAWSAATLAADIDGTSTNRALRAAEVYASSTRNEKVLLSRHFAGTTQYIYGQVYDGTTWSHVQLLATLATNAYLGVHNFAGTYLANGDFMAVYSDNTSTPKFRIWNGSAWSGQISMQTIPGIPNFIIAKARPGTNEVMAAALDQASDTSTQYFNNSSGYATASWTRHTIHATANPTFTKEIVDFDWSPNNPLIGALLYAANANQRNLQIRIWTANGTGNGTWSSSSSDSNQGTAGTRLGAETVVGRPSGATQFLACDDNTVPAVICNTSSSTPTWGTYTTVASTTVTGIQRTYHIAFEQLGGTHAINVYSDNTSTPKLKKYTASASAWDGSATSLSALGGVPQSVTAVPLTGSDDIMVLLSDANFDLYSIVWNGSTDAVYPAPAGKAFSSHGTNGSAANEQWHDFTWDNF
jgi:type II secretory pathway pseudopilin PulG